MIKAVIFDNGGVIKKHDGRQYWNFLAKKLNTTYEKVRKAIKPHEHLLDRGLITRRKFWQLVFKDLNRKFDPSYMGLLYKAEKRFFKIKKQVINLAIRLKKSGYLVPMLSNTVGPHNRVSRHHKLYRHFHPVILSHLIRMRKPNKNIYEYALKKIKLKPKECVFIDDKKENMSQPRKLGMHTTIYKNYSQLKKDLLKLNIKLNR